MAKVKVEVEIPDGKFCNLDRAPFCPFWWESEDGDVGCALLKEQREIEGEEIETIKFTACPNPE